MIAHSGSGVSQAWNPLRNSSHSAILQDRARSLALAIAHRMKDSRRLECDIALSLHQAFLPSHQHWTSYALAQGYAGVSLMFAHFARCFPRDGWEEPALEYFELAASGAFLARDMQVGAFTGMAGLYFAGRYLEESIATELPVTKLHERKLALACEEPIRKLRGRRGVGIADFDLISGLSGVSIALQTYGRLESHSINANIIETLISLSETHDGLPNFHCPKSLVNPADSLAKQFPEGYVNCGLAHGIPGPLFALSLAKIGHPADATIEMAVGQLAEILYRLGGRDSWGVNWPAAVSVKDFNSPISLAHGRDEVQTRTAWCYGNPGVSRALRIAATALTSQSWYDAALMSIHSGLSRPWHSIESPTFCHGVAGLLQVGLRYASEDQSPALLSFAEDCATRLIEMHDEARPFGYCSVENGNRYIDQPGLLDGAAGIALTLLSVSEKEDPSWDRIFCIN